MPLTHQNVGIHNGYIVLPSSNDPILILKTRITNTLRNLRTMGTEGRKTIEECDLFEDGDTLSYRGSLSEHHLNRLEFWEHQWRDLDSRFKTLSMYFNYRWDRENRYLLNGRRRAYDEQRVEPWVVATSCRIAVPAESIWRPIPAPGPAPAPAPARAPARAPAPYAKMETDKKEPVTVSNVSAQAATFAEVKTSRNTRKPKQAAAKAASATAKKPLILPSALRRSKRVASLKRNHDQITS